MKKLQAFSLTEILILIFAIAIVASVVIPMKLTDISQAERIAAWKSTYSEIDYSYQMMLQNEKDFINQYETNKVLSPVIFFDTFLKYCDTDNEKTTKTNFKKYRHLFLNGKIIKSISKYHANKFAILENGTVLAFAGYDRTNENTVESSPVGLVFVDINGMTSRNRIGKDVFILIMYPDKLIPMGAESSVQELKEDCSPVGSGLKCSAYYLIGGSF